MTKNERRVTTKVNPAPEAAALNSNTATEEFDYDKSIVDAVGKSLWEAIFDGEFRLAVKCRRCGRWLVSGASKRRHYGPVCALKAAREVS